MAVATKNKTATDAAIDLLTEDLIEIKTAARELPVPTSFATIFRWTQRGCRGTKLETVRVGARKFTTREAVARFLAATQVV